MPGRTLSAYKAPCPSTVCLPTCCSITRGTARLWLCDSMKTLVPMQFDSASSSVTRNSRTTDDFDEEWSAPDFRSPKDAVAAYPDRLRRPSKLQQLRRKLEGIKPYAVEGAQK